MDVTLSAPVFSSIVTASLYWDDDAKYVSVGSGYSGPRRTEGTIHLLSFTDDLLNPEYRTHDFCATYPAGAHQREAEDY